MSAIQIHEAKTSDNPYCCGLCGCVLPGAFNPTDEPAASMLYKLTVGNFFVFICPACVRELRNMLSGVLQPKRKDERE